VLVNINPAYRTAEVEYALNKVGCKALVTMARFKTSDYLGMLRELAPELACRPASWHPRLPELRTVVWIDVAGEGEEQPGMLRFSDLMARGDAPTRAWPRSPPRCRPPTHQHPVHQRHHGLPQGRHADAPQHPEQRLLHRRGMRSPRDRLCIPVPLYHCFGMVLGNLACITHGAPSSTPTTASTR
jgi:fatty-acyl-CoA synthase